MDRSILKSNEGVPKSYSVSLKLKRSLFFKKRSSFLKQMPITLVPGCSWRSSCWHWQRRSCGLCWGLGSEESSECLTSSRYPQPIRPWMKDNDECFELGKRNVNWARFHRHIFAHLLWKQGSISQTNLCTAFTRVAPKSVRVSQVVSIFLHFWDLHA